MQNFTEEFYYRIKMTFSVLFLLVFYNSYCQDSLSGVMAKELCSCLMNKKINQVVIYNDAIQCVAQVNEKESDFYMREGVRIYGDSITETQATTFAKEIGLKVSLESIKNCPVYRNLIDTARYSMYSYLNRDSLLVELSKINQNKDHNLNFYLKRCKIFFWLSQLKDAYTDAGQILILSSTNELGLHIKAMYLESKYDYIPALEIYNTLYQKSKNPRYAIDVALVKYKIDH
jgi:hypothetical protein